MYKNVIFWLSYINKISIAGIGNLGFVSHLKILHIHVSVSASEL
jgi:hypothetical protein